MDRNERKANSRNHLANMDRDSKFILRKIIIDVIILFCGECKYLFSDCILLFR